MKKSYVIVLAATICVFVSGMRPIPASAYIVEDLNFQDTGDIVLGPGKTELLMDKGDEYTKELLISNRSGQKKLFQITVEDFRGSRGDDQTVQFMGDQKGPYSLKDYVLPEITEIVLNHGQRLRLPVRVDIPETAEPGGLYGAVLVSAINIEGEGPEVTGEKAAGSTKVITRLASLFFVRIKGDVLEDSYMKDFKASQRFYEYGPISLAMLYENNGSVYESPYGTIEIKNMLGKTVDEIQVDPWFVMPDSLRTRELKWERGMLFGRYTAVAMMNRGYQNIIDTKYYSFWVIPWKIVLAGLMGIALVIWFFVWIIGHFEIKRKKPSLPSVP